MGDGHPSTREILLDGWMKLLQMLTSIRSRMLEGLFEAAWNAQSFAQLGTSFSFLFNNTDCGFGKYQKLVLVIGLPDRIFFTIFQVRGFS